MYTKFSFLISVLEENTKETKQFLVLEDKIDEAVFMIAQKIDLDKNKIKKIEMKKFFIIGEI